MKTLLLIIGLLCYGITLGQNNAALANRYFQQGAYQKAAQFYEVLQKDNPYNTKYLKRLITCFQEVNNYEKAERFLENKLLDNPNLLFLHVEIGYNFDRQQKKERAKKAYSAALTAIDINPNLGGLIGKVFQENNLLDYAIEAYSKTMSLNKNARYEFQIGQIYGEKGQFERMFDYYMDLINENTNNLKGVQRFISRYITEEPSNKNNIALKRSLLRKSISNPKNVWNELLSWLFTKQKEYGKAFVQEKALFKRDPAYLETIFKLGVIAFEGLDLITAKHCFIFFLEHTVFIEDRLSAELYLLKIAVNNKVKDCELMFKKTLDIYGINRNTIEIQIAFANYLTFQQNNPQKAIEILETALSFSRSKFQKATIKLLLGDIFVFTERFNKALLYFSQVQTQLKNHPLSQEARFKVAQTSYFKGDFNWAKSQLKVLKGSTSQLIANDAVQLFLIISDNESKDSIPSGLKEFAKADLLAYQHRNKEAIAVYNELLQTYSGQNIEDDALFNLAKIYLNEIQYEKGIASLLKLISIDPNGIFVDDSYYLLAETYKNFLKDSKKASEYYQKIIFEKRSSIYLVDARKKFRELRGEILN